MKKRVLAIILFCLLTGLLTGRVFAVGEEMKTCCKLIKAIEWRGRVLKSGATNPESCVDSAGKVDSACQFKEDDTVGPANTLDKCPINDAVYNHPTPDWGLVCMVNTVNNVTNWLFYLMTVVAVLLFIIGGVFYMASAGEPEKAKKGKTIIIYAIIGLVIALIAKMIPSLITTIVA